MVDLFQQGSALRLGEKGRAGTDRLACMRSNTVELKAATTGSMRLSSSCARSVRKSGRPKAPSGNGPTTCERVVDWVSDRTTGLGQEEVEVEVEERTHATVQDDAVLARPEAELRDEPLQLLPPQERVKRLLLVDALGLDELLKRVLGLPRQAGAVLGPVGRDREVDPTDELAGQELVELLVLVQRPERV